MRTVIVGASPLGVATARELLDREHEVVIIDIDPEKVERLSDDLDCGFITGDGTKPGILNQVEPTSGDILLCLTETDQDNILASLVGRTLGFERVITKVEDPEFEPICIALELNDTMIPTREAARLLTDLGEGREPIGLTATVTGDVRFFRFRAAELDGTSVEDLDLPEDTHVVAISNDDESRIATPEAQIKDGDEVLLITLDSRLEELSERFTREGKESDDAEESGD